MRRRVAPAEASAVIPARPCIFRDCALNGQPAIARCGMHGLEDDRRGAAARTINIERTAADIDGPADLRKPVAELPFTDLFIGEAACKETEQSQTNQLPERTARQRTFWIDISLRFTAVTTNVQGEHTVRREIFKLDPLIPRESKLGPAVPRPPSDGQENGHEKEETTERFHRHKFEGGGGT